MSIAGLSFQEDAKRQLVAQYRAGGQATPCTVPMLMSALAEAGFSGWAFDVQAIAAAAREISRDAPFASPLGRRADALYRIELAADRMSAFLTVQPPMGGRPATAEGARAALLADKIVFGVDAAAIEAAVATRVGDRVEVARGVAPRPGRDAYLEPLVEVNAQRHPKVGADGHVDFRDLGAFPSVAAGTPVMRRHPPEKGIPGRNVFGENIPAGDGKDLRFAVRLHGVAPAPDDPDVLVANTGGQPILLRDGVNIESVIRFEKVDLASGNVEVEGSVEIRGDVQSGMRITASGDITVQGTVESAELRAGGDIIARGGVVGHDAQGAPDSKKENTARLYAGGNVKARHIENAIVESGQSVYVDETLVACDVLAIDQVVVGAERGKGHIMGGFVRATTRVKTDELGAPGASQTRVFVGANPLLQRAIEQQKERLANKLKEHGELTKVAKILLTRPDKKDLLEKARTTLKKISEEIAEIMDEDQRLGGELKMADHAEIVVTRKVNAGCLVAVGKKSRFLGEDAGPTTFHLAGSEIVGS